MNQKKGIIEKVFCYLFGHVTVRRDRKVPWEIAEDEIRVWVYKCIRCGKAWCEERAK